MGKSCKEIAQSLVDCMRTTDCVKQGGDVRGCMKSSYRNGECKDLMDAYFACRRGAFDMRNRIKGQRVY